MKILFPIILILINTLYSNAGQNIIGKVIDIKTKKALPYASIAVSGKYMGTISNSEGQFVLSSENINENDTILISYMGYETLKVPFKETLNKANFYLKSANINLTEVNIYSRDLSPNEIIKKVIENYPINHPKRNQRQRLFIHNFIRTPFSKQNQANVIKSNFTGLEKTQLENLFDKMPTEFIDYNDAIIDLYSHEENSKLIPIQGISLQEGNQQALFKELEDQFSAVIEDFQESIKNPDIYYKFKTGLIGFKLNTSTGEGEENSQNENGIKSDSLSFKIPTGSVKYETNTLINHFAALEGDNTEFLDKYGKYNFTLKKIEFYNGELVYNIQFTPKRSGLFEGEIFISTADFGIHQMDYAYAKGKSTENIKLLGIGHAIDYRKGRVLFEKINDNYYLKYISAEENEMAALDRKFSLLKKEKRFLFDKELSEIKIDVDLFFNVHSKWELLVLEHENLSREDYEKIVQPRFMKFKKELAYSSEDWKNRSFIVPNEELKKYTRKNNDKK